MTSYSMNLEEIYQEEARRRDEYMEKQIEDDYWAEMEAMEEIAHHIMEHGLRLADGEE